MNTFIKNCFYKKYCHFDRKALVQTQKQKLTFHLKLASGLISVYSNSCEFINPLCIANGMKVEGVLDTGVHWENNAKFQSAGNGPEWLMS